MAPPDAPLDPGAVASAVTGLPAALFIGGVSGPLNAEASTLAEELDPKLEQIKVRNGRCRTRALAAAMHSGLRRHCVPLLLQHGTAYCEVHSRRSDPRRVDIHVSAMRNDGANNKTPVFDYSSHLAANNSSCTTLQAGMHVTVFVDVSSSTAVTADKFLPLQQLQSVVNCMRLRAKSLPSVSRVCAKS